MLKLSVSYRKRDIPFLQAAMAFVSSGEGHRCLFHVFTIPSLVPAHLASDRPGIVHPQEMHTRAN